MIPHLTPTRYLALANGAGALFTLLGGVYQARVLGPEQLGVMAVITGIVAPAFILVDVRLNDAAARAFYDVDGLPAEAVPGYRAGILWLAWLGGLGLGLVAAIAVSLVGHLVVPVFTRAPVAGWWLPAEAFALTLSSSCGGLFYLLRFSREFYAIGNWRIVTQAVQMLVTVAVLTAHPSLAGAFAAGLASGAVVLVLTAGVSARIWIGRAGLPLGRPDWGRAYAAYRRNAGMLVYGNLLGYSKVLSRGIDVLVVAYFAGDRETGLYKLARQLVDGGVAVMQDALHQVYFPSFLDLASRRAAGPYRALARRLTVVAGAITLAAVAGGAVLLPVLVPVVFGAGFAGAHWPMLIMTLTFFFIAGCQPWLWALFVHGGRLGGYSALTFLSVAVQYGVMLGLFRLVGPTASAGMTGMLAYYVCLIPLAYALAHRRFAAFLPGQPTAARARAEDPA